MSQRPLRVLHVLDVLRFSGAETCLKVAGPFWADHDISCDVVATGPELGEYAHHLSGAGYRTGHLPLHPARRFFPRLWRLIESEQYDVVHTHIEKANAAIDLLVRARGTRSVQHVHQVFDFQGRLRTERLVQRRVMRAAGVTFVSCSPDVQTNEADRFDNPSDMLLNWADLDHFSAPTASQRADAREHFGIAEDSYLLTSVANCHDFKNHTSLIKAMVDLPEHVRWLHVGVGPLTGAERSEAEALGVADRITFAGRLPDPLSALHAADCYIQPSLHEGMSIAALEALATTVPAVLTDVPGQRLLRPFGAAVRWADQPTPEAVATAVTSMMTDGPPPGDSTAVRRAIDPETAVARLAQTYRGAS